MRIRITNILDNKILPKHFRIGNISQFIFFILLVNVLVSCNSTKITYSWRDPGTSKNTTHLNKFIVAVLIKNQGTRDKIEDQFVSYYQGKAIQAYKELGEAQLKESTEFYSQKLRTEGFDGIVILRLLHVDKKKRYIEADFPEYYRSWGALYVNVWNQANTPGYFTTDSIFEMEVNVYSIIDDKLLGSITTSTINPSGRENLYDDVIKAVRKKIKKEGYIK